MNRDEIFPLTAITAPPSSDDEAIDRISELGTVTLHGLIGAVFLDVSQFRRALASFQWNCKETIVMRSGSKTAPGRVITYKIDARGPDGTEYEFLVNQVGLYHSTIVNCRLKRAGTDFSEKNQRLLTEALQDKESFEKVRRETMASCPECGLPEAQCEGHMGSSSLCPQCGYREEKCTCIGPHGEGA